jgi:hypothetical protein
MMPPRPIDMDGISPEIIEALKALHRLMPERWLLELPKAIECIQGDTRYGEVRLIITDGRIVGVDRSIKSR